MNKTMSSLMKLIGIYYAMLTLWIPIKDKLLFVIHEEYILTINKGTLLKHNLVSHSSLARCLIFVKLVNH